MGTGLPSFSFHPSSDAGPHNELRPIAALWRRLVAFLVDSAILGLIGLALGLFFFNLFSQLGPWGRMVGFFIAMAYFAIFESSVGGGQSLGKLWLKIIVVDAQGNTIPFDKAVLRYTIFAAPWFLNGLPLPVTRTPWIAAFLLEVFVIAASGATLYLLIFNRATRQGLHDLAAGSYVASATESGPVAVRPFWTTHWIAVGLIAVAVLVVGVFSLRLTSWGPLPELMGDLRFVERLYGAQRGTAFARSTYTQGGNRSNDLEIDAYFDEEPQTPYAEARYIARHLLLDDPRARMYDSIRVVIAREYDIGIARGYYHESFENSPEEWSKRVLDTPLAESPEEAEK